MAKTPGFYEISVGKKILMAVTGIIMFLFVLVHMLGNLQIYLGPDHINAYANFLHHGALEIVWATRIALVACFLVHIVAAVQVWLQSRRAKPDPYSVKVDLTVGYAARTMIWTGPIVLLFVLYHLAHLTMGWTGPVEIGEHIDVYSNIVRSFSVPWIAGIYIVANFLLGVHLYHGLWSLFQTLGVTHPRIDAWRRRLAVLLSFVIAAGNISIPVSVLLGLVK